MQPNPRSLPNVPSVRKIGSNRLPSLFRICRREAGMREGSSSGDFPGSGKMSPSLACKEISNTYIKLSKITLNIFRPVHGKPPGHSMLLRSGMAEFCPASPILRPVIQTDALLRRNVAECSLPSSWSPSRRDTGGWSGKTGEQASWRVRFFFFLPATGTVTDQTKKRAGLKTGLSCVAPLSMRGWGMVFWTLLPFKSIGSRLFGHGLPNFIKFALPIGWDSGPSHLDWR